MAVPQVDLLDLIRKGTHYAETRGEFIHILEMHSGRTIAVHNKNDPGATLVPRTLPDGTTIWSPQGHNLQYFQKPEIQYNPMIVDLICQKIVEGKGITEICGTSEKQGLPGFPTYSTYSRWRRTHPELMDAINQARLDRAEFLRDKALQEGELANEDDIEVRRLRSDLAKWAAGVDDGRFSPKAKVEATFNVPTQIIVHTGINKEPLDGPGDAKEAHRASDGSVRPVAPLPEPPGVRDV
jgi:hypothetical protein